MKRRDFLRGLLSAGACAMLGIAPRRLQNAVRFYDAPALWSTYRMAPDGSYTLVESVEER